MKAFDFREGGKDGRNGPLTIYKQEKGEKKPMAAARHRARK